MFSKRLKDLRIQSGMTQEQLSKRLGIAKSTISMYENGNREPDFEMLEAIADAFNVNIASLIEKEKRMKSPTVTDDYTTFPIIGEIAAGYDLILLEDWTGDTIDIPNNYLKGRKSSDFLVLRIKGNSMYPIYHDGDAVLILKQSTINNSGDIGAVIYDDEIVTLKKIEFSPDNNWLKLVPLNPEFIPKKIEGEDLNHCRIIGIPKLLIREI